MSFPKWPMGPIGPTGNDPYAWTIQTLRAVTKTILMYPRNFEWSTQGFGMLRTYVDHGKKYRLNVWDKSLAVPNVSVIHDHPWSFTSWILSGDFTNVRYDITEPIDIEPQGIGNYEPPAELPNDLWYNWQVIRTGPGGGPEGGYSGYCRLRARAPERYAAGSVYHQDPTEIHASVYTDGTVTINDRVRLPDGDHARVFWPAGESWIDAEPRDATPMEVANVTAKALELWN